MRIFIGIPFQEREKKSLENLQKIVMEKSEGGRFADPKNFHLTLKFIGEIPEEKLQPVRAVVKKETQGVPPFKLVLQGFGTFFKGKTCIPWLGVTKGMDRLQELQEKIEQGLEEIGYEKESRPFRPHMTFGRKVRLSPLAKADLEEKLTEEKVALEVSSIAIMESTRKDGKLVYPVIEEFPLENRGFRFWKKEKQNN
ncbi:RNA 2',3'-cyclic phosphodiesterase [Isachenkonia alkalipeptolytica]|uniref:RNA 2',3'-cyclic phosphodiesterase n=1 Tax=Isachenkonia alkalipeptolytica TaxID=2565777 RepID=A0AA43XL06_9CLOT|nr:RNA 2',3'-cyclic phosphodiesterase [Isachenkonia alkalipeptolytica]NBG88567.1 RNA 2',3'-cyclic phosphodiesterase [Isachenkonia alkalipeptolytica]